MRALLDTSAFLWFIAGSPKLSEKAKNFMIDSENELLLSIVSLWEIAIKVSNGKLELAQPFDQIIPDEIKKHEIKILPIQLSHLSEVMYLTFHHRDPFDRLIIAQGITEKLPIIAKDEYFESYPVELIW